MVYQVGTIRSLMAGVDVGDRTIGKLREYGDFGLGTFDGVNGEMIALEGAFWRADGRGILHRAEAERQTPFAVVCRFRPERGFEFDGGSIRELHEAISERFDNRNIIYALHIRGKFETLHLRSEKRHSVDHRPLPEILPDVQSVFRLHRTFGDLAGFWFPEHMEAINLPGFHLHFIDESRHRGGHLFDGKCGRVTVEIMSVYDFGMHLIHTPLFATAALEAPERETVRRMEDRGGEKAAET